MQVSKDGCGMSGLHKEVWQPNGWTGLRTGRALKGVFLEEADLVLSENVRRGGGMSHKKGG